MLLLQLLLELLLQLLLDLLLELLILPDEEGHPSTKATQGLQSARLSHIGFILKPLLVKSFSLTCVDSPAKNKRMVSPRDDKSGRPGRAGYRRMGWHSWGESAQPLSIGEVQHLAQHSASSDP